MKTNIKALNLVEKGLSPKTVSKLTESQINVLYSKLLGEQVTNPNIAEKIKNIDALDQKLTGLEAKMTKLGLAEKEIDEDDTLDVVKDPDATEDGMGMFEEKEIDEKFESKKQQKYFFSKCGDGKTKEQKKWCKMADEFAEKTNFAKLPEKGKK